MHGRQAGTISSCDPPRSISIRWSAVVAGFPHQWHGGLSASRAARFCLYSVLSYGVGFLVIAHAPSACASARCRACCRSLMLDDQDGLVFVVFVLCTSVVCFCVRA